MKADNAENNDWFEDYNSRHELVIITMWRDFKNDPIGQVWEFI